MESDPNTHAQSPPSTQSNQSRHLKIGDCFDLISNAAIPLMIGVISLWIAIHQQNIIQVNREKDIAQAAELRKQDLEQARLQREEDKETARLQRAEDIQITQLQREEDQETARLQRDEDRETARLQREEDQEIARLQRELDLNITSVKRIQDDELAEKERNLSEIQRSHEFEVTYKNRINDLALEDDRRQESVLLEYQDDFIALLLDYGQLLRDPESKWWFILQMKTGAALRQLDPTRRTILIHTLLDAWIFRVNVKNEESIVFKANLSGVEFGKPFKTFDYINDLCTTYEFLYAVEADLRYASFNGVCLYGPNPFSFSNLDYTDWSFATLMNIDFTDGLTMVGAKFTGSILVRTTFIGHVYINSRATDLLEMDQVLFQYNIKCDHCRFEKTSLQGARLDYSNFMQSVFLSSSMPDCNMSNASFKESSFLHILLDRVNLSQANLQSCTFFTVSMINCSMYDTKLDKVKFEYVNLTGCKGLTDQQLSTVSIFYETTLPNGTFIQSKKN